MTKLSIIIPTYNNAELLSELLTKLVCQQREGVEIIAIDDGSTEDMSWLDFYASIKVFHKPNGGAASAKNVGLDNATGEYVAFVDSDDDVTDDFIEKILEFIKARPDGDIHYFKCTTNDGAAVGYHEPCAWGKVVRRSYIGDARFDENYNIGEEDTLFLPLAEAKPPRVVYCNATLYHYRWSANPDSLMKRFWRKELPKRKV